MGRVLRFLALLFGFAAAGAAWGQEAAAERRPPDGYAFADPRLLTQQLLWGLVHGVHLLADSCRNREDGAVAALAYADWLDRQRPRIAAAARDLARHYYDRDAVSLPELAAALHLRQALDLPLEEQAAACASFPEALATQRYDLQLFYDLRRDAARLARAEAVRAAVDRCRPTLAAEPQAALDQAFAAWEAANGATETLARARFAGSVEISKDVAQWRREAGGGAVPAAVACDQLAARLGQPSHALATVFGPEEAL